MRESDSTFGGLPIIDDPDAGPRRIVIATVDLAGPYHCGGVGAAYHGLSLALAKEGHDVTLLYLHHAFHQGDLKEWTSYFKKLGIRFVHHPQPVSEFLWYGLRKEASLCCYQWLADHQPFDVIHFHEWLGLPYYTLLAKQQGLAFGGTVLCVGTHGPMRWSRVGDHALASRHEDLVVDYMERKSVELADVVVSPSRYLLEWMVDDRWSIPDRSYVEQNILEPVAEVASTEVKGGLRPVRELVFFGRLDRRKGLPFFSDVIDQLREGSEPFKVTFLGMSNTFIDGQPTSDYIRTRAKLWSGAPFTKDTPSVLGDRGRIQAHEYLHGEGRLAVIPSMIDNSPCTVQECIQEGIPFLVSDVGGIKELIHPDDHNQVTCPLDVRLFSERLTKILREGQFLARPAVSFETTRNNWCRWHQGAPRNDGVVRPPTSVSSPLISICIAHFERPNMLAQMVNSIHAQTYAHFEVVIVDDGSRQAEAVAYLQALEKEFAGQQHCTVLFQKNQGPGVARHRAAENARGSYLLFVDDDDALAPGALETFARVANHTRADALVCVYIEFEGDQPPDSTTKVKQWYVPLGPALGPGLIYPELGGTIYMVRREVYFEVGGFPIGRDVDEDWEFLLNVVASGHDLQVIPEPLLWYREQPESRSRADNRFVRNRSRIELFEKLLPVELRDLAALAYLGLSHIKDAGTQRRLDRVREVLDKKRQRMQDKPA